MRKEPTITAFARGLRHTQTSAERALWAHLSSRRLAGVKFRRQQPIGSYIVDFVSFERKLIIEIDGGRHDEIAARERDKERSAWLEGQGYRVLRFWNNEILGNAEGVFDSIRQALE